MGYLFTLIAVVAWGFEYVLVKQASDTAGPVVQGVVVFCVGGTLLTATGGARRLPFRTLRERWRWILVIGLVGTACNLSWLAASRYTTAANMAILSRTDVLFSLLLGALVFSDRIRGRAWLWVPIMLAGIPLTVRIDPRQLAFGDVGDGLMLLSALLLALNAFLIKRCMKAVPGILLGAANCTVNAVVFIILLAIVRPAAPPWRTVLILATCGCCTYVFMIAYYAALKRLPVWEVRLLCLAVPVVAALVAWLWLGTVPTWPQVGGAALIIGGAAGIILGGRRSPTGATDA